MTIGTRFFARPSLALVPLVAVLAACSAPVDSAESTATSASATSGGPIIITSLWPISGPNTGGTTINFSGQGFSTGTPQFLFGGVPGTQVQCASDTHCTAIAPPGAHLSTSQEVPVWAVVNGVSSTSPINNLAYTYDGGPPCTSQLTCSGVAFGFPDMIVTCPGAVRFYDLAGTPNETLVATAASYRTSTNDVPHTLSACASGYLGWYPDYVNCTDFVVQGPSNDCGTLPPPPPDFCTQCEDNGGTCSTYKGKKTCIYN
jgi:hypothetical protein